VIYDLQFPGQLTLRLKDRAADGKSKGARSSLAKVPRSAMGHDRSWAVDHRHGPELIF
jgi:hypothetical protein